MDPIVEENETTSSRGEIPSVEQEFSISICREVWNEFYSWATNHCNDILGSLSLPVPENPEVSMNKQLTIVDDFSGDIEFEFELLAVREGSETFVIEEFDQAENPTRYSTLRAEEGYCDPNEISFKASPPYEFCTSTSQNYVLTDPHAKSLAFLPYADDPTFSFEEYLNYFESLAWQTDFFDPDMELILLEAATRLYFDHSYSLLDIEQTGLFPLRNHRSSGLLWETAQRDIPWWTGIGDKPRLQDAQMLTSSDLLENLDRDLPHFCPLFGCLRFFCPAHTKSYPGFDESDEKKPKLTGPQLQVKCSEACGDFCYKNDEYSMVSPKLENEIDPGGFTENLLKIIPDEMPCDLAIICRKRCNEVFRIRCRMYDDEDIIQYPDILMDRIKPHFWFKDVPPEYASPEHKILPPCHHPGPCNKFSCECFREQHHCQRSCRCSLDCFIRWKGCACHSRKKRSRLDPDDRPCKNFNNCKCRREGRECDPDLCVSCDARGRGKRSYCQNVKLQRGEFPMVSIGPGTHGLGAFARETIPENTIVGEYVGEIISREDTNNEAVRMIHRHTKRNYLFDLDKEDVLDSAKLGNETRFLNDPRDSVLNANCDAKVVSVNGQHRIEFISSSTILKGEELLLSYGEKYWNEDLDEGSSAINDSE